MTNQDAAGSGWNEAERAELEANIKPGARSSISLQPAQSRWHAQYFRASGEPIFDRSARFIGYRGIAWK